MRALEIPTIDMSTPIRWRHDRPPRRRPRPEPRPLTLIKSALGEAARVALAEPFMLSVERQDIYLRRLPRALDGLRIIHLSDFHYGPLTDSRHLERAVQAANDLRPDLIALTGDYISHDRSYAAPCAELISRLRARYGVFAVLGNHDHWTDAELIADLFRLGTNALSVRAQPRSAALFRQDRRRGPPAGSSVEPRVAPRQFRLDGTR